MVWLVCSYIYIYTHINIYSDIRVATEKIRKHYQHNLELPTPTACAPVPSCLTRSGPAVVVAAVVAVAVVGAVVVVAVGIVVAAGVGVAVAVVVVVGVVGVVAVVVTVRVGVGIVGQ